MDMPTALLTLIHIFVFVYWLGGDLGAFYVSNYMVDPARTLAERRMALRILNNVDMAPRTCLILALPTGLALAWMKGWLPSLSGEFVLLAAAAGAAWLWLAWAVHLNHGAGTSGIKRLDIAIRWVVLTALFAVSIAGVTKQIDIPLFIALKMAVLAACIGIGLIVRRQIVPLFVAFAEMVANGAAPATDAAILAANAGARRMVLTLWALLLVAAYLGVATPV